MRVLIFHGWGASSRDNWFPWLKKELESEGHDVLVPDMPNSRTPNLSEWMAKVDEIGIDEETVCIGHSLGTILLLRVMEKKKLKKSFLIASFDNDLGIQEIKSFF